VNHVDNAGEAARETLRGQTFVRELEVDGARLRLVVTRGGEAIPVVLRLLEGRGIGVADISLSRPSLDDVFLRVTGHLIGDAEREVKSAGPAKAAALAAAKE
jgi:ABC-2 type transport system ATP-binding protein